MQRDPADDVLDRTAETAQAKMRAQAASEDVRATEGESGGETVAPPARGLARIVGWLK